MEVDMVNHPPHYTVSPCKCRACGETIECIDITKHMNFCEGNATKYIYRWRMKGGVEDLKKAVYYLNCLIAMEEDEK